MTKTFIMKSALTLAIFFKDGALFFALSRQKCEYIFISITFQLKLKYEKDHFLLNLAFEIKTALHERVVFVFFLFFLFLVF